MSSLPEFPREKVLDLRIRSKTGGRLTDEEQRFVAQAWKLWPQEYAALNDEVQQAAHAYVNPLGGSR